jgi:hypothetical protein
MKLPCPACGQALNLPDKMAGKVVKCPACQQSFDAPGGAEPAAGGDWTKSADAQHSTVPGDELALHSLVDQQDTGAPDPTALEICPGCGAKWKKGSRECKKCHYNAIAGAKLKAPYKRSGNFYFDYQKVFLYVAFIALCFGIYWVYTNFDLIKQKFDKLWDQGSRQEVTPDSQSPLELKKPKRTDRGD